MRSTVSRSLDIDVIKGVACVLIVTHHLAFYGPMSDIAYPLAPALLEWLREHARLAVQVFLVLGGYMVCMGLMAKPGTVAPPPSIASLMARRYLRLALPLFVALLVAVLAAELVRPWLDHPSVPGVPSLVQLLANVLLLQDLVGQEALSAGVWYVAIDFQLYVLAVLSLRGTARTAQGAWLGPLLVCGLMAASLLGFNRQPAWDAWGVYFFGAYGMGMVAAWAVQAHRKGQWNLVQAWVMYLVLLGLAALALDFRGRIAVAWAAALGLVLLGCRPLALRSRGWQAMAYLGQRSYSVFLIHFAVSLLVNAVFGHFWPSSPWTNALGMGLSLLLSLLAGALLYERVERHVPTWGMALRWQASLLGIGLLAAGVARP